MVNKFIFASIAILVLFMGATIKAQESNNSSDGDIKLEISTDKKCYKINDEIEISVVLNNTGINSAYFYREDNKDFLNGFELLIYNSEDKLLDGKNPRGFNIWKLLSANNFLKLEPNKSISDNITFKLSEKGVNKKGRYSLRAYYHSPISTAKIPNSLIGEKVWTLSDNDIFSPKLTIEVLRQCKE